jgi:hypothetical protein
MANTYMSPAQAISTANTLVTLYTVPANTQVITSNIHVCNLGDTSASIRIAVRKAAANIANQHYLFFGLTIAPFDTIQLGDGITMGATDVMSVWASNSNISFNLSYAEVVPD